MENLIDGLLHAIEEILRLVSIERNIAGRGILRAAIVIGVNIAVAEVILNMVRADVLAIAPKDKRGVRREDVSESERGGGVTRNIRECLENVKGALGIVRDRIQKEPRGGSVAHDHQMEAADVRIRRPIFVGPGVFRLIESAGVGDRLVALLL